MSIMTAREDIKREFQMNSHLNTLRRYRDVVICNAFVLNYSINFKEAPKINRTVNIANATSLGSLQDFVVRIEVKRGFCGYQR